jgi:hypothetical protein
LLAAPGAPLSSAVPSFGRAKLLRLTPLATDTSCCMLLVALMLLL